MAGGVEILLEPRTRIARWIRNQTLRVKIKSTQLGTRRVRSLRIHGGEAGFFPGGGVVLKMPGSDEFWGAFQPLKVLEIRNLKGELIKRNYHLCPKCGTLTGEVRSSEPASVSGPMDAVFECTACGEKWELAI